MYSAFTLTNTDAESWGDPEVQGSTRLQAAARQVYAAELSPLYDTL